MRLVLTWRLEGTVPTVGKHLQQQCKDAEPQRSMEVFLSERAPTFAGLALERLVPGGECQRDISCEQPAGGMAA